MSKSFLALSLAGGLALALGADGALAGPGGGHGGGGFSGGVGGGFGPGGRFGGSDFPSASTHLGSRSEEALENRQGPNRASDNGVANANEHARMSSAHMADLASLKTGMTVKESNGTVLGKVRKIERSKSGVVRNVLVASAAGKRTIRISPNDLSISGGVVMTSEESPR